MYIISMDKKTVSKEVGTRISHYRKLKGLTQVQIGEQLRIPQGLWTGYERGHRNIPISLLRPIAEILEVSVADLLGEGSEVRRRPGPISKLDRQFAAVRELPRDKQKAISTVLEMALQDSVAE